MFPVLGISRSFGIHLTEPNSSTMKSIILALALVAIAAALPVEREPVYPKEPVYSKEPVYAKEPVKILRSESQQDPQGSYSYNFETEDGSVRSETGELKEILDEENKPHTVVIMRGFYSYNDNLGNPQKISYFADDTGFHAEGESIPKPVEPVSRQ